ncbi:hypothetical protein ACTMNS_02995 [Staphylococcus haemolyticus]
MKSNLDIKSQYKYYLHSDCNILHLHILKRRTKNAKAFHDKCENAYLGCWVLGYIVLHN